MDNEQFNKLYCRAINLFDGFRRFTETRPDSIALLDDWEAMLAEVDYNAADSILESMAKGYIPTPHFDWGELVGVICREAHAYRKDEPDLSGPRYECPLCLDSGIVTVFNPRFVEDYRETFATLQAEPAVDNKGREFIRIKPENWFGAARSSWVKRNLGPVVHTALCNCACKRQRILATELQNWRTNTRKNRFGEPSYHTPACGAAEYNPRIMPRTSGDYYESLRRWYAEHGVNAAYEWQGA